MPASPTAFIRSEIASLLDSEDRIFTRQEIELYIRNHDPNSGTYTSGMYSGALRSLTYNSAEYEKVGRAEYRRRRRLPETPIHRALSILTKARDGLLAPVPTRLTDMEPHDYQISELVRECIAFLDERILRLRTMAEPQD